MKKLSIIIPVYNEEKTIQIILNRLSKTELIDDIDKEIILVDDGSKDTTSKLIQSYIHNYPEMKVKFFKHLKNKGKGAAVRRGIQEASGDYLVIQDADLEYDPNELHILLKPIYEGQADVVYGSRFVGSNPHRVLLFWHYIGNKFLTLFSNLFSNLNLSDMETGYKMFRTDIIKQLELKENRFGFEPEITAKIAKIPDIRIYEVGISYYGRTYKEGKKIKWKDGLIAIFCILKYNINNDKSLSSKQARRLTVKGE
jgi:glycosyltransferase involved in cell wall biosynthesis